MIFVFSKLSIAPIEITFNYAVQIGGRAMWKQQTLCNGNTIRPFIPMSTNLPRHEATKAAGSV